METPDSPTFGQWMRRLREAKGWTIIQCAEKASLKWQAWQRLENDEPKRRDGSPSRPTRMTVLKIASALETPEIQALQAARYVDKDWDGQRDGVTVRDSQDRGDGSALDFVALYEALDFADREYLLQLALFKWKRNYPNVAPPILPIAAETLAIQPGEFLCLDLRSGQMSSASGIQSGTNILDHHQQLLDILVRLLTWQDDPAGNAEEIVQDLRQVQQVMEK